MKNKISKNLMILAMLCAMIFSSITTNFASAESISQEEQYNELITKATPYVYLDKKTESFKIQKDGKIHLTKEELAEVENIINSSNEQVKLYRSDLEISGNKFIPKTEDNGDIQTLSINKKNDFDWDFTWWGLQVYWSHAFVETLKKNIVLYGAGTAALNATIAYYISPPGWVTSLVAAVAGVGVWAFIQQDKGCGVYLDCYLYVPTRWYSAC